MAAMAAACVVQCEPVDAVCRRCETNSGCFGHRLVMVSAISTCIFTLQRGHLLPCTWGEAGFPELFWQAEQTGPSFE